MNSKSSMFTFALIGPKTRNTIGSKTRNSLEQKTTFRFQQKIQLLETSIYREDFSVNKDISMTSQTQQQLSLREQLQPKAFSKISNADILKVIDFYH